MSREITIRLIPRDDGGLRVCSDDAPGLILSGPEAATVMTCILPALDALKAWKTSDAFEECALLCENEAAECVGDIVPGDEIGRREANARAGALLTAAADIRALRHKL